MFRNKLIALLVMAATTATMLAQTTVVTDAERFLDRVEQFDTLLHNVHAPEEYVKATHHMEETAHEIYELAQAGKSAELKVETKHLLDDMQSLYQRLLATNSLLKNNQVVHSWNNMVYAFRTLRRTVLSLP